MKTQIAGRAQVLLFVRGIDEVLLFVKGIDEVLLFVKGIDEVLLFVKGIDEVLLFVKVVKVIDEDFKLTEELASMQSIKVRTTGYRDRVC